MNHSITRHIPHHTDGFVRTILTVRHGAHQQETEGAVGVTRTVIRNLYLSFPECHRKPRMLSSRFKNQRDPIRRKAVEKSYFDFGQAGQKRRSAYMKIHYPAVGCPGLR